jgi:hypothetical protein
MKVYKILWVLFFSLLCHIVSAQISFNNYVITGVTIIDVNHRIPLTSQTVVISNNIISNIFKDGSQPIPQSFNVLRMDGKYILPGLIDAHVHVATDPSGVDNRQHTLDVLQRILYSGVTSVRDMAGDARTLASLSRDAEAGDIISPNIYYSALMAESSSKGAVAGTMPYMQSVTDSTNIALAVAEAKGTGATGIKLYANLSVPLVNKIVAEAARQNILVWGHAWLQVAKPSDLVKAGVGGISHSSLIIREKYDIIPSSWKDPHHDDQFWDSVTPDFSSLFTLMKDHHTILDATLLTYKQWGKEDSTAQFSYEIGKRITIQAYKAGVIIDAGTDVDQKEFVHKEIELLVKEVGFTELDAIIAATLNSAKALNIDTTRGTISKGKIADLLILNENPLTNIENIESVYLVIKNGKIFKK